MSQQLPSLVDALFQRPTLDRLDQLLAALYESPREQPLAGLIDDLLDYRVAMAQGAADSLNQAGDSAAEQRERTGAVRSGL